MFEGNISQIPAQLITLFYRVLPCPQTEEMTKYKNPFAAKLLNRHKGLEAVIQYVQPCFSQQKETVKKLTTICCNMLKALDCILQSLPTYWTKPAVGKLFNSWATMGNFD